jgi:hypothetical protein
MSNRRPPIPAQAVGRPVALFGLARLLLQLRNRPTTLHLVHTNDDTRRPVPAQLEGQV